MSSHDKKFETKRSINFLINLKNFFYIFIIFFTFVVYNVYTSVRLFSLHSYTEKKKNKAT